RLPRLIRVRTSALCHAAAAFEPPHFVELAMRNRLLLSGAPACLMLVVCQSSALAGQAGPGAPSSLPEQVVITASPLTNDPNAIATTVGAVDRDQILKLGGANIADVLKDLPGVSATTFASGASRPVIRGFDASRVR